MKAINEKCKNDQQRELRKFGISFFIVLCFWGGILFWRQKDYYYYFFIAAILFLFAVIIKPLLIKPIHKILTKILNLIILLISRTGLILLFYLGITPVGLLAKLCGKRFLDLKLNRETDSYWISRLPSSPDKKHYENQF